MSNKRLLFRADAREKDSAGGRPAGGRGAGNPRPTLEPQGSAVTIHPTERTLETPDQNVERSIWQQLADDHQVQASIMEDIAALIRDHSFITATKRFGELRLHLGRHICAEEELFTLCEQLSNPPQVLEKLRVEHAVIQGLIQHLAEALSRRAEVSEMIHLLESLQETLNRHELEERNQLFPALERLIPDRGRYQRLLLKLAQR